MFAAEGAWLIPKLRPTEHHGQTYNRITPHGSRRQRSLLPAAIFCLVEAIPTLLRLNVRVVQSLEHTWARLGPEGHGLTRRRGVRLAHQERSADFHERRSRAKAQRDLMNELRACFPLLDRIFGKFAVDRGRRSALSVQSRVWST